MRRSPGRGRHHATRTDKHAHLLPRGHVIATGSAGPARQFSTTFDRIVLHGSCVLVNVSSLALSLHHIRVHRIGRHAQHVRCVEFAAGTSIMRITGRRAATSRQGPIPARHSFGSSRAATSSAAKSCASTMGLRSMSGSVVPAHSPSRRE